MAMVNIEFKARLKDLAEAERKLLLLQPNFAGEDHQTDTYFNVSAGRLKLREGNIENALIYYHRNDLAGTKKSDVMLHKTQPASGLKELLGKSLGVKVVVNKTRRIYFVENVKIHFDTLEGLGSFVEVEAIDEFGTRSLEELENQCRFFAGMFEVGQQDYISISYSDMLL